MNMANGKSCD